jgi:hypothetical protein
MDTLWDAAITAGIGQFAIIQAAATSAGVDLKPVNLSDAGEVERAITAFARGPNGGLIVTASALSTVRRDLIIALAARHKLPAVYFERHFVTAGGLISYGANFIDQYRSAASYACDLTSSIVPRGTSCHRAVEFAFSPVGFDLALLCGCSLLLGPAGLGAVNPDTMHDHGQPARQRHDRLLHPAAPGDLHRPGLEPRPFR